MDPITMMALGGAALGALSNKKDRKKGALMGLGLGLLGPAAFTALAPATAVAAPVAATAAPVAAAAAPIVTSVGTMGAAAAPAVTAGATGALNGVTAGYGGALGSGAVTAAGTNTAATATAELAAAELAKKEGMKRFLASMGPQALGAGVQALTPQELQAQQTNYNASIAGVPQQAPSMYQRAAMNMQKERSHLRRMSQNKG